MKKEKKEKKKKKKLLIKKGLILSTPVCVQFKEHISKIWFPSGFEFWTKWSVYFGVSF